MFNKMTIEDVDVAGKLTFVRVDFNVPLDENRKITDDIRIRGALPTIKFLIEKGARVVLASHLGRPKGERKMEFSLKPAADRLSELLGKPAAFAEDCIGDPAEKAKAELKGGEVLLLENLRFYKQEEKNDPEFCKALAKGIELYVNDAFGTAHRAHASTEGITKFVSPAVSGYLLKKELDYLGNAVATPKRPFVAILGGAKVSGKIDVIKSLMSKVDTLIVGGGMAYTFYKAQGKEIGKSLLEEDRIPMAKDLLDEVKAKGINFLLPVDCVVADDFKNDAKTQVVNTDGIPAGWQGLDIGPKTVELFSKVVKEAATVVWNGPMGVFEMDNFAKGTNAIAKALAESSCISIIGGGDSAAAVKKAGLDDQMSHISTGGGASIEFLEGKTLPGVAALNDK